MKRLALAAALATAFVAAPSFASSASTATLGPLVVTLHDLDPLDGISSSISFTHPLHDFGSFAGAWVSQSAPNNHQDQRSEGTYAWAPVAASATSSLAWANASLAGSTDTNGGGAVFSASGAANSPTSTNPNDSAFYSAYAYLPFTTQGFTLSANTLVTFSAASTVSGHADYFFDAGEMGPGAYAEVGMGIYGPDFTDWRSAISADSLSGRADGSAELRSFSNSRTLQVSFANSTAQNFSGTLGLNVDVSGNAFAVTAVPEPETYAMLLAGLGLMGSLVRRKKKQG